MVLSGMAVVGGTKLFLWMAALLLTNLLTAVIFTITNQTNSGYLCPIYPNTQSLNDDSKHSQISDEQQLVFNRDVNNYNNPLIINSDNDNNNLNQLQTLRSQLNLDVTSSIKVIQANCTVVSLEGKCRASRFEALLNLADTSLCRCEPGAIKTQVDKCMQERRDQEMIAERQRKWEELEAEKDLPTIFAITPTYARTTQKVDLTSLCQTVMHIPKFVWIVIEDSEERTPLVIRLLQRCKVKSVHLNVRTPQKMRPKPGQKKNPSLYSRGVEQRNTGLEWIRQQCSKKGCRGVVYFMDDDNKYDLRLFEEMRKTVGVSVFPVGFSGGLKLEGPLCVNGTASKWHAAWDPNRPFPIDMAGFSINVQKILDKPDVQVGLLEDGKPTKRGYLETSFLENFATRETVECRGLSNEILVWHVKTQKPLTIYEGKHPSDPLYEF